MTPIYTEPIFLNKQPVESMFDLFVGFLFKTHYKFITQIYYSHFHRAIIHREEHRSTLQNPMLCEIHI